MSRRRKRKKLNSLDEDSSEQPKSIPPLEKRDIPPTSAPLRKSKATEIQPLPLKRIDNKIPLEDELDLGNDFADDEPSNNAAQIALPSSDDKKEIRTLRRTADKNESDDLKESEASQPQKRQRIAKTAPKTAIYEDELGSLDDNFDDIPQQGESIAKKETQKTIIETPSVQIEEQNAPSEIPAHSFREIAKNALNSLSLFEQASIGLLAIILVIATIWSTAVVSARIPNTIIASKLKYPLKGNSVVLASYESYWRTPIREGTHIDEGVSETIEIIPEIKISLDSKSKAKSLRFLFRDEEGRFVGDSSTVNISGSKFLPSENVTSHTKGNTATIRSTTGFEHKGELISYLADETFQWEIVILESKDGIEYTEFMAIPISANRKDNS